MKNIKKCKNFPYTPENFPISSSLGLLAYGDIAFKMWRQVKLENKNNEQE